MKSIISIILSLNGIWVTMELAVDFLENNKEESIQSDTILVFELFITTLLVLSIAIL